MSAASSPDVWIHVRIIIGMVLGLILARLVNGLTRFVQHPGRDRIDPVHFGWTLYFFVLLYAMLFVAVASLLYPDKMDEYASFGDYFQSRRRWFYGLLTVCFSST
jgi:hypothetical protein